MFPSAELLFAYGYGNLSCLVESVNEGCHISMLLAGPRPQPDCRRDASCDEQLEKLSPRIGDVLLAGDLSVFKETYYLYLPFFACEVKYGAGALEVADHQNAHSMTIAARGVVLLFRCVKREHEVHRQILAFLASHDHCSVRIFMAIIQ